MKSNKSRAKALVTAITISLSLAWSLSPIAAWGRASGGRTIAYSFQDRTLLLRSQQRGGLVYIADGVPRKKPVPLVVFLHGLNARREAHLWFHSGGNDLRRSVDAWIDRGEVQPALFAAPSQTVAASNGTTLWTEFDLDAFVEATEAALRGAWQVDRSSIVVVGHSAAGCNVEGGLASLAAGRSSIRPRAIVAIDICMDDVRAAALARAPADMPVHVYWQESSWSRQFHRFLDVFAKNRAGSAAGNDVFERLSVRAPFPHTAVVPLALARALQQLLPGEGAR